MNNEPLEISVVIVNWNTAHLLGDCLESLAFELASHRHEIIIVDNGSTDESKPWLADNRPDIRLIENQKNVGYQAACNRGSFAATGSILLHINADARLTPGALNTMLAAFDRLDVGVVGPRLVYGDGAFQRWTAGRLPSLASVGTSFVLGDRLLPGRGLWVDDDHLEPREVGWVSSACLMVRRDLFVQVGGLDEHFFAYMDDVDLCSRAHDAGLVSWYEPRATAIHFMGGSQTHPGSAASPVAIDALAEWFRHHHSARKSRAAAALMASGFALRAGAHGLRSLVGAEDTTAARNHIRHTRTAIAAAVTAGSPR